MNSFNNTERIPFCLLGQVGGFVGILEQRAILFLTLPNLKSSHELLLLTHWCMGRSSPCHRLNQPLYSTVQNVLEKTSYSSTSVVTMFHAQQKTSETQSRSSSHEWVMWERVCVVLGEGEQSWPPQNRPLGILILLRWLFLRKETLRKNLCSSP